MTPFLQRIYNLIFHAAIHQSVIRRSVMLLFFVTPGHVLNFALLALATHMLAREAFGVFYTSVSIINMIFMPASILALLQIRAMSEARAAKDEGAAVRVCMSFFKTTLLVGGVIGLAALMLFLAIGTVIGVDALILFPLIVLSVLLAYAAETVRAGFQGLQRFFWMGFSSLSWMFFRFVISLCAIYIFSTAYAGVAGFTVATALMCVLFYPALIRGHKIPWRDIPLKPLHVGKALPFITGLGIFSAMIYADTLMGYLVLDKQDLGIYSASSVLPKAVVLLCLPVAQVLFPMLTEGRINAADERKWGGFFVLAKGAGMTAIVCIFAIAVVLFAGRWVCGGSYGIGGCDVSLLSPLMLASVPLCLLRVLVMYHLSHRSDWFPLLLAVPLVSYGFYIYSTDGNVSLPLLAQSFHLFSWISLSSYAVLSLVFIGLSRFRTVYEPSR